MAEAVNTSESGLRGAWNDICKLGLQPYVADLDTHGYTVIPPEIASPNGLTDRMLDACLDIAEKRNGEKPDLETGSTHANLPITPRGNPDAGRSPKGRVPVELRGERDSPVGDVMHSIFFENQVFEESLMNPVLLAMATYLCGYSVVLSGIGCWMKGPNVSTFRLHTDTPVPSPLPSQALVCELLYVLTDFNRENGGIAFVPGSHKWCRNPEGPESIIGEGGNDNVVAAEAKAGSLIVWPGTTWHGSFNRTAPGLRVSVPLYMVRPCIRTQENFIGRIPQEALDRHPPRFAILTQQGIVPGYEGPADEQAKAAHAEKHNAAYAEELGGGIRRKNDLYG
jgi:hypothetical protein